MRGKANYDYVDIDNDGITPAHAGKSVFHKLVLAAAGDHPRPCGEKAVAYWP